MTPEAKVKTAVKRQLDALGAYYFFPQMGGFGRAGVPDIIGCFRGRFFAVECKAGKNKTTALQEKELGKIQIAGGVGLVIYENNIQEVTTCLKNF